MNSVEKELRRSTIIASVVVVIALLVGLVAMYAIGVDNGNQNYQKKQAFLNDVHTCPDCGWTGHAGQMRIVSADPLHLEDYYYCPNCGALLGQY